MDNELEQLRTENERLRAEKAHLQNVILRLESRINAQEAELDSWRGKGPKIDTGGGDPRVS